MTCSTIYINNKRHHYMGYSALESKQADNLYGKDVVDQLEEFMLENDDVVIGAELMPDAHLGYSVPIGTALASKAVMPEVVGYDIYCSVSATPTTFAIDEVYQNQDAIKAAIEERIPMGTKRYKEPERFYAASYTPCSAALQKFWTEKNYIEQMGTLGSGNHFIEIGISDDDPQVWFVIHTGSRGIGHDVAQHYMDILKNSNKHYFENESQLCMDYLQDRHWLSRFVEDSHKSIKEKMSRIMQDLGIYGYASVVNAIFCPHNYVEYNAERKAFIHRKGAIDASKDKKMVIPGSVTTGTFLAKGECDSMGLISASHGAGRTMSRNQAKKTLKVEDFRQQVIEADVAATVSSRNLDEAPDAYKDIIQVLEAQEFNMRISNFIKPIINCKGVN